MIVAAHRDRLVLVRQVDHQEQCGRMARAWGSAGFFRLPRWDSVVRAAERHDDGWRLPDEAPSPDPTGRPVDFPDVERAQHAAFYAGAIADVVSDDPWAGLVCCLHGRGLYEKRLGLDGPPPPRAGRPAVERDFILDQESLQKRLEAALGAGAHTWGWDAFRLLQAWDALSLYLVWTGLRRNATWRLDRIPVAAADADGVTLTVSPGGAHTAAVSPWPFTGAVVDVPVTQRTIPSRVYRDVADLSDALAAADEVTVGYRLIPGGAGGGGDPPPRHAP